MHSAIRRAIRIELEPRFTNRAVLLDKERHLVGGTFFLSHVHLRVHGRTGPTHIRLLVTACAIVQIEAWPEDCFRVRNRTLDRLNCIEGLAPRTEQLYFECVPCGDL